MTTSTVARTRNSVKEGGVRREYQRLLRRLTRAIAAAQAAGPDFTAIVDDLLSLKLTPARLIDALREAEAA